MGEAAGSRRMLRRAAWKATATDEESRSYLQARLEVLARLMFWSFVAILVFIGVMYWKYPDIEPPRQRTIQYIATGGLLVLACSWVIMIKRQLRITYLNLLDGFYALGAGTVLAMSAVLGRELEASGYACLLYACFMVLLRAIVVPSTGRRTAILGALTFAPIMVSAFIVGSKHELPPGALIGGVLTVCVVVTLLATIGSRIIYGLRQKVSAAMVLGQYTLDRKIGEGGMGAVYRAHHVLLRRPTAIKLLLPDRVSAETLDRFEREVQHTSQLSHANTVAVFDYGRSPDGVFYYAMEYLDGIDLEHLVLKYGPQPAGRTVNILVQICGALHEAHRSGIIHRDIKPANIILCERGAVPDVAKVVDFGLVKEISARAILGGAETGDTSMVILGTPAYVAPEAVTDPHRVGPAADLYALGAVGYFLLTGRRVFDGKTSVDVCIQHVTAQPVPPSQVAAVHIPAELEALIMKCLSKRPDERPSAATLAKLLRALPSEPDWSEDQALAWWEEFRTKAEAETASSSPTLTITVDLGHREEPTPPLRTRAARESHVN